MRVQPRNYTQIQLSVYDSAGSRLAFPLKERGFFVGSDRWITWTTPAPLTHGDRQPISMVGWRRC